MKFKAMGLKAKLIALFLVVGILSCAVIGVLSFVNAQKSVTQEIMKAQTMFSEVKASQLEEFFGDLEEGGKVIATSRDLYHSLLILRNAGWNASNPAWSERKPIIDSFFKVSCEE